MAAALVNFLFPILCVSLPLLMFLRRLLSNTHALYPYHPIPTLLYPQLQSELFCNIYFLRHLCDSARFPSWPISKPVELLKDVLDEWKREVEKKPSAMSADKAYEALGLGGDGAAAITENDIRKAYFKMAAKYHPDKNPDGREMFELYVFHREGGDHRLQY